MFSFKSYYWPPCTRIAVVAELTKTERLFHLYTWLHESGTNGLGRQTILDEYGISDKTFRRYLEELDKIMPMAFSYDKDEQRLFYENISAENMPVAEKSESIEIKTLEGGSKALDPASVHFSRQEKLPLGERETELLVIAILEHKPLRLRYRDKERIGIPHFLYAHHQNWYLLFSNNALDNIQKYRLDRIQGIEASTHSALPFELSITDLQSLQTTVKKKLSRANNIFIDLNAAETVHVQFRFFLDEKIIEREIQSHYHKIKTEKDLVDLEIDFSGYWEARMFCHQWLGHFQILAPTWFREQYIDDIEDAIGIL